MPRREVKDVPGPDLELGAVVHSAIHGAGQYEPHMMELAARSPGDGPHVLGPPPAGLQRKPADHQLSDSDRARRPLLEREGFVGSRHVLHPRTRCVHPSLPRSAAPARDTGAAQRPESLNVPTSHLPRGLQGRQVVTDGPDAGAQVTTVVLILVPLESALRERCCLTNERPTQRSRPDRRSRQPGLSPALTW
jgi:hypothetical protein